MQFRLLGPLEAVQDEHPVPLGGGKQRALLAVLLLHAGRVVPIERLVDDLWAEDVPETATKSVQIYVSRLRKVLPPDLLRTRAPGYLVDLGGHELDLDRFEELRQAGRAAIDGHRAAEAADAFRQAVALWRGPALAEFGERLAADRARLEEARLVCTEDLVEAELSVGRHTELVGELEALVTRYPLRERLRGQHLLALYRAGRQAEALAAYQDFRRLLGEELGIDPSQTLRELERRMLQQDPGLDLPPPPPGDRTSGRTAPRRGPTAPGAPATFVGRDVELGRLRVLLDEALAGDRRLVLLTGRPGIGKTTLVEAFVAEAEADADVLVGRGRCFEQYGSGEAFMPLLDALESLSRGPASEQVVGVLGERAPSWLSQMPWLAPSPAAAGAPPAASRGRMLRELAEALEAIAGIRPLLLVLEDLHWSDASTMDLVNAVARRDAPARLLVLATFRPGDARAAEHPVARVAHELELHRLATQIGLEALPLPAVTDYLGRRFPGALFPVELTEVLRERTDGSPLFLEQVVDAWVESGAIACVDGAWTLTTTPTELGTEVPPTVRQLIELQLDRLDPPDRELIETASVAGAEFSDAVLAAACERPEEEVEARLAELARAERHVVSLDEMIWPDGTVATRYRFSHDLYQEIAYRRLPPGRRARLHRAIGLRLEAAHGDRVRDIAAELATHFLRGREPGRAVGLLRIAAEQALARSGQEEAIGHLTAALETLSHQPDARERDGQELELRIALGDAFMETRGYAADEVRDQYIRARDLCVGLEDHARLVPVLHGFSTIAEVAGRYGEADELARELLRLAPEGTAAHATGLRARGWPLLCMGRFSEALETLARIPRELAREPRRPTGGANDAVEALCVSAWALWFLGRPDESAATSHEAVALGHRLEHPFSIVYATTCDAFVRQLRGERELAAERARTGLELAQQHGLPLWEAWVSVVLGWAETTGGDAEAGLERIQAGLDASAQTGAAWARSYLLGLLADAAASAGRRDEALAALDDADAVMRANGEQFYAAELMRLRGELLLPDDASDSAVAEERFVRALALARDQGARSLELRAALSLARVRRRRGEPEDGTEAAAVYASFAEGLDTPDLQAARAFLDDAGVAIPTVADEAAAP